MTDNDDSTPRDDDSKGGPVENPSKLPDWNAKSVDADGLDEGDDGAER